MGVAGRDLEPGAGGGGVADLAAIVVVGWVVQSPAGQGAVLAQGAGVPRARVHLHEPALGDLLEAVSILAPALKRALEINGTGEAPAAADLGDTLGGRVGDLAEVLVSPVVDAPAGHAVLGADGAVHRAPGVDLLEVALGPVQIPVPLGVASALQGAVEVHDAQHVGAHRDLLPRSDEGLGHVGGVVGAVVVVLISRRSALSMVKVAICPWLVEQLSNSRELGELSRSFWAVVPTVAAAISTLLLVES